MASARSGLMVFIIDYEGFIQASMQGSRVWGSECQQGPRRILGEGSTRAPKSFKMGIYTGPKNMHGFRAL